MTAWWVRNWLYGCTQIDVVILPLYSDLMRYLLQYCIQHWGPQHKKDVDLLEQIQKKAMRIIRGLEKVSHEDRMLSLEKRSL